MIVDKEKVEEVIILDIGGDILATGNEKGLKSPIADASVLSACNNLYVPVKVWVSGCGLDGELSETELQSILNTMNYSQTRLSGKLALKHLKAFEWLPSEASALFFMASAGYRGVCEIRQDGYSVELSNFSSAIFCIDFDEVYLNSKIADRINQTQSLVDIEKIVKDITSISELDIERKKKTTVQNWNESRTKEEMTEYLLELSHDKKMNGISFLTRRRICELLHIKGEMRDRFIFYLKENYPEYFIPPLWKCM